MGTVAGLLVAMALFAAAAASSAPVGHVQMNTGVRRYVATGIHKIRHVVIIMQENRSFDNYFGTYPGAAGIPLRNGKPAV